MPRRPNKPNKPHTRTLNPFFRRALISVPAPIGPLPSGGGGSSGAHLAPGAAHDVDILPPPSVISRHASVVASAPPIPSHAPVPSIPPVPAPAVRAPIPSVQAVKGPSTTDPHSPTPTAASPIHEALAPFPLPPPRTSPPSPPRTSPPSPPRTSPPRTSPPSASPPRTSRKPVPYDALPSSTPPSPSSSPAASPSAPTDREPVETLRDSQYSSACSLASPETYEASAEEAAQFAVLAVLARASVISGEQRMSFASDEEKHTVLDEGEAEAQVVKAGGYRWSVGDDGEHEFEHEHQHDHFPARAPHEDANAAAHDHYASASLRVRDWREVRASHASHATQATYGTAATTASHATHTSDAYPIDIDEWASPPPLSPGLVAERAAGSPNASRTAASEHSASAAQPAPSAAAAQPTPPSTASTPSTLHLSPTGFDAHRSDPALHNPTGGGAELARSNSAPTRRAPPPPLKLARSNNSLGDALEAHTQAARVPGVYFSPHVRSQHARNRHATTQHTQAQNPYTHQTDYTDDTDPNHTLTPRRNSDDSVGILIESHRPSHAGPAWGSTRDLTDVALTPHHEKGVSLSTTASKSTGSGIGGKTLVGILKSARGERPREGRTVRLAMPPSPDVGWTSSLTNLSGMSGSRLRSPMSPAKDEYNVGVYREEGSEKRGWRRRVHTSWIVGILLVIIVTVAIAVPFAIKGREPDPDLPTKKPTLTPPTAPGVPVAQCLLPFVSGAGVGAAGVSPGRHTLAQNPGLLYPCTSCLDALEHLPNDFLNATGRPSGVGAARQYCALVEVLFTSEVSALHAGGWGADMSPCLWSGVSCDVRGRITALQLVFPGVPEALPSTLEHLVSLRTLRIVGNGKSPTGLLPPVSGLANLTVLDMQYTGVGGALAALPPSLRRLTLVSNPVLVAPRNMSAVALETLVLADQGVTSLPGLPSTLTMLDLSHNNLTGSLAPLLALPRLRGLYLQNNDLERFIPPPGAPIESISLAGNPRLEGGIWAEMCAGLSACDARGTRMGPNCSRCFYDE